MSSKHYDSSEMKSHWHEIRKKILSQWNQLNEEDVDETKGDKHSLRNLVTEKYGKNAGFEKEYERICRPFADQAMYSGKTPVERDLRKKTAADGFNEPDDEDEEGMTRFDDMNADYTGLAMSEADQEELLKPDLQGMDASEAQTTPETTLQHKHKHKNKSAPDELKPNQDPRSAKSEDITLGRSNSSANTTSPSALTSSGATKKL